MSICSVRVGYSGKIMITIIADYCLTLPKSRLSQYVRTHTINAHNFGNHTLSWHLILFYEQFLGTPSAWMSWGFLLRGAPSVRGCSAYLQAGVQPKGGSETWGESEAPPYGGNLLRWCTTTEKNAVQREGSLWRTALCFITLEKLESTWQIPLISSDFHQRFRTAKEDSGIISECLYGFGAELVMA